jgi:hypothetical protein
MFDPRPILTDRLKALGVFSGIAVAAVSGFELVITGSLDPITPSLVAEAPSEYDEQTVMQAWHYRPYVPTVYVTQTSQYLGYPLDSAATETLAGGPNDLSAPDADPYSTHSEEDLAAEIDRLYEESQSLYLTSYSQAQDLRAEAQFEVDAALSQLTKEEIELLPEEDSEHQPVDSMPPLLPVDAGLFTPSESASPS